MAGALALGEYLAGAVIALMLAGGNALEEAAGQRARRDLTALVRRGGELVEVAVDEVAVDEVVLVRAGEVVPVDGMVVSEEAIVDESALTGEPLPETVRRGGSVRSGTASVGRAFELRALRPAAESAYAAVVRLVTQAENERAPFVRMADRYAAALLPVTTVVAAVAWAVSGEPVRALAVFVVATPPCPLILAAPIAFMSGLSRAARIGVVVKGSGTIEKLGGARSVLLDKTGTVTLGHPELDRVVATDGFAADDALRLAASLDQLSAHPIAKALVAGAEEHNLPWRSRRPPRRASAMVFAAPSTATASSSAAPAGSAATESSQSSRRTSTTEPPTCSSPSTITWPPLRSSATACVPSRPTSYPNCAMSASATSHSSAETGNPSRPLSESGSAWTASTPTKSRAESRRHPRSAE